MAIGVFGSHAGLLQADALTHRRHASKQYSVYGLTQRDSGPSGTSLAVHTRISLILNRSILTPGVPVIVPFSNM